MEDLEKKIKEAARKAVGLPIGFDYEEEAYYNSQKIHRYDTFIQATLSPEAKEYWQQGMYTEEEVLVLLFAYMWNSVGPNTLTVSEWFEQNKKKS